MKKKNFHIALLCFLGLGLLFNQVGLSLFHDKHEAHEWLITPNDQAQYHSHGEHCQVCATDTLFTLFFQPASSPIHCTAQPRLFAVAGYHVYSAPVAYTQGRAPPLA